MSWQEPKKLQALLGWRLLALPHGELTVSDLLVVAVLTALGTMLHGFGWFDSFETASLDASFRLKGPSRIDEIRIVTITDDDYEKHFGSSSPLRPEMIGETLEAIGRGNPRVIAVDLNLEPTEIPLNDLADNVPIVWATDARFIDGKLDLINLTGRQVSVGGPHQGLALFPQDRDGVIRRYRRQYPGAGRQLDSLPWATVRVYCRKLARDDSQSAAPEVCAGAEGLQPDEELLLNFAGNRYAFAHLSLSSVLRASTGDAWAETGPLVDRIVVIGGTYHAARDEYITPVGARAGVEIVAQAIATELQQSGIRDVDKWLLIGLEFLGGLLIAIVHHSFSVRVALILSIVGIPVLAMISSMAAFLSLSRWANFVPVLVGTLIHQLYASAKEADKLRKAQAGLHS